MKDKKLYDIKKGYCIVPCEWIELPPLNSLTNSLKWGIPTNTKISLDFMRRQSP